MIGRIKWFNDGKGYGFIECENLADIFVHYSSIIMEGYKSLNKDDIVEFSLIETCKGLQATNVKTVKMSIV